MAKSNTNIEPANIPRNEPVPGELLSYLLDELSNLHSHLCPRQVLGVRMGLVGGGLLGIKVPQDKKKLLAIVETNGCFTDGISVATNCWIGKRSLRVEDYGKIAATFLDIENKKAIRVFPKNDVRERAQTFAPAAESRWEGYLLGYQRVPSDDLFEVEEVKINFSVEKWLSREGVHRVCSNCGEEIFNEREIMIEGKSYCRACLGNGYYLKTR